MTDDEVTGFMQALADGLPEVDPPVAMVIAAAREAAHRQSRRRSTALAGAVAAAVVAVAVGSALVHTGSSREATSAPRTATSTLVAPADSMLVGARGVMIAIPATWAQVSQPVCGPPGHPYYFLAERVPVAVSCAPQRRSVAMSSLEIDSSPTRATASPARCAAGACVERLVRRGVTFTVTVAGGEATARDQLATIGGSLRDVPSGYSAVPLWPLVETHAVSSEGSVEPMLRADYLTTLARAGVRGIPGVPVRRDPRRTAPAQGAVVARGSAVTLGTPTATPTAPPGMKLVGMNGVAIGVPSAWTQGRKQGCGEASSNDSYHLDVPDVDEPGSGPPACIPASRETPNQLVIGPADETLGSAYLLQPSGDGVVCRAGSCVGRWTEPARGVRFVVSMSGPAARATERIMASSVQSVPDGWTTVPAWPVGWRSEGSGVTYAPIPSPDFADILAAAGLYPVDFTRGGFLRDPRAVPAEGSVLRVGSPVDLRP